VIAHPSNVAVIVVRTAKHPVEYVVMKESNDLRQKSGDGMTRATKKLIKVNTEMMSRQILTSHLPLVANDLLRSPLRATSTPNTS
jgi:hypothetical protein